MVANSPFLNSHKSIYFPLLRTFTTRTDQYIFLFPSVLEDFVSRHWWLDTVERHVRYNALISKMGARMMVYTVDYRLADGQQLNPRYRGWYSWELLLGVYRPILQILTRFQTKKCNYPYPFSDLAFWQKLCYHYLAVRAQTQKFFQSISNSHISLSFLLIVNWNDKKCSYTPVVPSKTQPDFRSKSVKCIPVFRPKRAQKPYPVAAHTCIAYIR